MKFNIIYFVMGFWTGLLIFVLLINPALESLYSFTQDDVLDGLDYYNDSDFMTTYWNIETDYWNCYDKDWVAFKRYSLNDLQNCSVQGFDCEDFSTIVYHLGKHYDIPCKFYYSSTWWGKLDHAGIECLIGSSWMELN